MKKRVDFVPWNNPQVVSESGDKKNGRLPKGIHFSRLAWPISSVIAISRTMCSSTSTEESKAKKCNLQEFYFSLGIGWHSEVPQTLLPSPCFLGESLIFSDCRPKKPQHLRKHIDTERDPLCEDEVRLLQRFNGHEHIVCLHEVYSEQGADWFQRCFAVVSWWVLVSSNVVYLW